MIIHRFSPTAACRRVIAFVIMVFLPSLFVLASSKTLLAQEFLEDALADPTAFELEDFETPPLEVEEQPRNSTLPTNELPPPAGFVRLNLEGNVRLEALLKLVENRMNWNLIYDAKIGDRQINVRAPRAIPAEALPTLVNSVLRMENLAVVDAGIRGWKRIIDSGAMVGLSETGDPEVVMQRDGGASPVTSAFVLKHLDPQTVNSIIRPFLTKSGSDFQTIPNSRVVILTDFAPVVLKVQRLIKLLDQPRGEALYQVYPVKNLPSGKLAEQVKAMLGSGAITSDPTGAEVTGANQGFGSQDESSQNLSDLDMGTLNSVATVGLFDEPRTNQIVVVGTRQQVSRAIEFLERFDVSLGLKTVVYRLQHVRAERLSKIIKSFVSPRDADRAFQSTIDEEGNLLIVRTTPAIHGQVEELRKQLDQPVRGEESPIRFYRLKNANATDVLYTLLALQEVAGGSGSLSIGGSTLSGTNANATSSDGATSPFNINITPSQTQPRSLSGLGLGGVSGFGNQFGNSPFSNGFGRFGGGSVMQMPPRLNGYGNSAGSYENIQRFGQDRRSAVLAPQLATGGAAQLPGGARVSADITTNSLVLVGPAEVQELYGRLIKSLDVRRPQVMVEAKIVAIDTTGDFSLGVEISGGDRQGDRRLFSFSSFGLSEVDPTNGALSITPSLGFNGTLIDPSVADVVVKALTSHSRVNVIAEPRILVNDNATGQLESVTSVPFQSVNASDTVATTSLGGDQTAGTTITVTPRIKEDDHMQMEFSLEFSTFGEGGSSTLPPPRQIDRVGSEVTIPSGHTVIVGGLQRANDSHSRSGIPFVESIPVLRQLTGLTTNNSSTTAFFVFLKPVILRDPKFEDLKHLSSVSAKDACVAPDYPVSYPVMMVR